MLCGVAALLLSFRKEKMWILPFWFHLADSALFLKVRVRFISNKVFLSFQGAPGVATAGMKVSFTLRCNGLTRMRLRTRPGVRRAEGTENGRAAPTKGEYRNCCCFWQSGR